MPWPNSYRHRLAAVLSVAILASFAGLTAVFPNTFWFERLWASCVLGTWGGFRAGRSFLPFKNADAEKIRGRERIHMAVAIIVVLPIMVPDFWRQERMRATLRELRSGQIEAIDVRGAYAAKSHRNVQDRHAIEEFVERAKIADLVYPSHEGSLAKYRIVIHTRNRGDMAFDARVPERHTEDLYLQFRAFLFMRTIRIPFGREWISPERIP